MVIISYSYGKDSTTMLLKMLENHMQVDKIIFADTQYELPEMLEYQSKINKYLKDNYNLEVIKTKPYKNKTFEDWFYGKFTKGKQEGVIRGFPYVLSPCYWSREAKYIPLTKMYGKGNTICIGYATNEMKRANGKQYKNVVNKYRFPLIEDFKIDEVACYNFLKEKGLEPPTKLRTGCWWCPKQSQKSLRYLYENHKDLWEQLKKWEADSPHGFRIKQTLEEFENKIKEKNNV